MTKQIISIRERKLKSIVRRVNEILDMNRERNIKLVSLTCPGRSYVAFVQFDTDLPIGNNKPSQYVRLNQM